MEFGGISDFATRGGPAIWAILALSVAALAVALWKLAHLARLGAWSSRAEPAIALWLSGDRDAALAQATAGADAVSRLVGTAMRARLSPDLADGQAREETARVARALLGEARGGLRVLDLTVTIAPLLGLFGTVLGMIAAFQALQAEGNAADAATLAGGIWQALLTTAAGMGLAIPASIVLSWFESVTDRLQARMEDAATRIFTAGDP